MPGLNSRKSIKSRERNTLALYLFYFVITFLVFQFGPTTLTQAALAQGLSAVGDYANRISQAEQAIDEVIEQENPAPELVPRMNVIKRLLPASEEIEFNGSVIHVDNAWLHEALNKIIQNAEGDIEQRYSMLSDISDRLANLHQSVRAAQTTQAQTMQDQSARLNNILARPEYQPEEKRSSVLENWIRRLRNFIVSLMEKLFGGSSAREPQAGGSGGVVVFRILVLLTVVAALIFGAIKLAQRWQYHKRPEEEAETREVLGEEIAEDATAADLFANASDLARQGEYRKAIRRTYIALLCDLEQRGKLRLGRSKTNRDYLEALQSEPKMFPSFSMMTNAFEHVWYGQERATEEEFRNFVALYRETVR